MHVYGDRRLAFLAWLRTGRLPTVRSADGIELKFNPWHDPENGRFTFANNGKYFAQWGGDGFSGGGGGTGGGAGASGTWDGPGRPSRPRTDRTKRNRPGTPSLKPNSASASDRVLSSKRRANDNGWPSGKFNGGGGGDFGGGGASATGNWGASERSPQVPDGARTRRSASDGSTITGNLSVTAPTREQFRTVVRNGYAYQIDARERTRRISGTLTLAETPRRSRTLQARAGGNDRRRTDDGGHYIAARFDGPTAAFNHFAQDASFNRGGYRALEDQWARAKRAGRKVFVRVVPVYEGASGRPSEINIWFTIDGRPESQKFSNGFAEKKRGD